MTLEQPARRILDAAAGYCELGMFHEAASELATIGVSHRAAPESLALSIEIYCGLEEWELMRASAKRLGEVQPDNVQWIIAYAFACRRISSVATAKKILLQAIPQFPREPAIFFFLACYDCQLGRMESAKDYLDRAVQIDPTCISVALKNEDLQLLMGHL